VHGPRADTPPAEDDVRVDWWDYQPLLDGETERVDLLNNNKNR